MTHYSNRMSVEEIQLILVELEDGAFESRRDGCTVTIVTCKDCKRLFENELETAKCEVENRRDFLCLGCRPDVPF